VSQAQVKSAAGLKNRVRRLSATVPPWALAGFDGGFYRQHKSPSEVLATRCRITHTNGDNWLDGFFFAVFCWHLQAKLPGNGSQVDHWFLGKGLNCSKAPEKLSSAQRKSERKKKNEANRVGTRCGSAAVVEVGPTRCFRPRTGEPNVQSVPTYYCTALPPTLARCLAASRSGWREGSRFPEAGMRRISWRS